MASIDLSVTRSHSRPHCANDNPCSKLQVKTVNYRSELPGRIRLVEMAGRSASTSSAVHPLTPQFRSRLHTHQEGHRALPRAPYRQTEECHETYRHRFEERDLDGPSQGEVPRTLARIRLSSSPSIRPIRSVLLALK